MCSLPGPQDSFLQHDQNLFPYTSCPNADFMAPWVLLTEKPCITAMKSEGKNPLSRHVVFRVNASCAALTLKAFSVRHPEQRAALITRHPSSSSQRFLKPPSFSPFQSSQRLQPLGGTVSSCLPFWVPWTPMRWGRGKHRHICGIHRLHICSAALGHKGVSFPGPCDTEPGTTAVALKSKQFSQRPE